MSLFSRTPFSNQPRQPNPSKKNVSRGSGAGGGGSPLASSFFRPDSASQQPFGSNNPSSSSMIGSSNHSFAASSMLVSRRSNALNMASSSIGPSSSSRNQRRKRPSSALKATNPWNHTFTIPVECGRPSLPVFEERDLWTNPTAIRLNDKKRRAICAGFNWEIYIHPNSGSEGRFYGLSVLPVCHQNDESIPKGYKIKFTVRTHVISNQMQMGSSLNSLSIQASSDEMDDDDDDNDDDNEDGNQDDGDDNDTGMDPSHDSDSKLNESWAFSQSSSILKGYPDKSRKSVKKKKSRNKSIPSTGLTVRSLKSPSPSHPSAFYEWSRELSVIPEDVSVESYTSSDHLNERDFYTFIEELPFSRDDLARYECMDEDDEDVNIFRLNINIFVEFIPKSTTLILDTRLSNSQRKNKNGGQGKLQTKKRSYSRPIQSKFYGVMGALMVQKDSEIDSLKNHLSQLQRNHKKTLNDLERSFASQMKMKENEMKKIENELKILREHEKNMQLNQFDRMFQVMNDHKSAILSELDGIKKDSHKKDLEIDGLRDQLLAMRLNVSKLEKENNSLKMNVKESEFENERLQKDLADTKEKYLEQSYVNPISSNLGGTPLIPSRVMGITRMDGRSPTKSPSKGARNQFNSVGVPRYESPIRGISSFQMNENGGGLSPPNNNPDSGNDVKIPLLSTPVRIDAHGDSGRIDDSGISPEKQNLLASLEKTTPPVDSADRYSQGTGASGSMVKNGRPRTMARTKGGRMNLTRVFKSQSPCVLFYGTDKKRIGKGYLQLFRDESIACQTGFATQFAFQSMETHEWLVNQWVRPQAISHRPPKTSLWIPLDEDGSSQSNVTYVCQFTEKTEFKRFESWCEETVRQILSAAYSPRKASSEEIEPVADESGPTKGADPDNDDENENANEKAKATEKPNTNEDANTEKESDKESNQDHGWGSGWGSQTAWGGSGGNDADQGGFGSWDFGGISDKNEPATSSSSSSTKTKTAQGDSSSSNQTQTAGNDKENDENDDNCIEYTLKPIADIPEQDVLTGHEEETLLGEFHFQRLYRWGPDVSGVMGWKTRCTNSSIEFWKHRDDGRVRMTSREEITSKLRLNQYTPLTNESEMKIQNGRSRTWPGGIDATIAKEDDSYGLCSWAVKFKEESDAQEFHEMFMRAQRMNQALEDGQSSTFIQKENENENENEESDYEDSGPSDGEFEMDLEDGDTEGVSETSFQKRIENANDSESEESEESEIAREKRAAELAAQREADRDPAMDAFIAKQKQERFEKDKAIAEKFGDQSTDKMNAETPWNMNASNVFGNPDSKSTDSKSNPLLSGFNMSGGVDFQFDPSPKPATGVSFGVEEEQQPSSAEKDETRAEKEENPLNETDEDKEKASDDKSDKNENDNLTGSGGWGSGFANTDSMWGNVTTSRGSGDTEDNDTGAGLGLSDFSFAESNDKGGDSSSTQTKTDDKKTTMGNGTGTGTGTGKPEPDITGGWGASPEPTASTKEESNSKNKDNVEKSEDDGCFGGWASKGFGDWGSASHETGKDKTEPDSGGGFASFSGSNDGFGGGFGSGTGGFGSFGDGSDGSTMDFSKGFANISSKSPDKSAILGGNTTTSSTNTTTETQMGANKDSATTNATQSEMDDEDNCIEYTLKPIVELSEKTVESGHEHETLIAEMAFKKLRRWGPDVAGVMGWKDRCTNSVIQFYQDKESQWTRIVSREEMTSKLRLNQCILAQANWSDKGAKSGCWIGVDGTVNAEDETTGKPCMFLLTLNSPEDRDEFRRLFEEAKERNSKLGKNE